MNPDNTVSLGKGMSIYKPKAVTTSARDFIKIVSSRRREIKTTKFIPPKLGSKRLGRFYIEFE